ncbi:hypothetical protein [Streptomyces sp. NPDC004065]|uniref:hypothetical protein n=1 Tax=Streptomyces sp. NPDC004065 TaxID=3364689 RepID=UPI00384BA77E
MNVLVCAARGRRLSDPPRPLPVPPELCPGWGARVATLFADCSGPYETHFLPGAVRTVPA